MPNFIKGLDANQVLRSVYDDTKNTLRVSIVDGSTGGGSFEVIINHVDDSIRLGNGTDFFTSTYIGPKVGLDVAVISSTLPTGAATEAKQDVGNASLASIDSKLTSPITVTGPLTNAQLRATPVPISGIVTANQGTSPWITSGTSTVSGTVTANIGTTGGLALDTTVSGLLTDAQLRATPVPINGIVTANAGTGTFLIDGSAHIQPVSGTVGVTQSTSPWVVSGTVTATPTGTQDVNILSSVELEIKNDVGNPVPVSGIGNFNVTQATGTSLHTVVDSGSITANPVGLKTGLATSQLTVTDVAQKVPTSDLTNRNVLSIRILGSNTVYFGNSTVTTPTGYPKYQYEEIVMDVQDKPAVDIWAICPAGQTCVIAIMEIA